MEKFSQFRDKGSGIAPFLPIPTEAAGIYLPFHALLFAIRMPLLLACILSYFFFIQWLPIGAFIKKVSLWSILGSPGLWWVDLQVDGVKKGTISKNSTRLPKNGSIIASSRTSPIDALYLAAIFDPIFTASYPDNRLVQRISLLQAVLRAFGHPLLRPPPSAKMYDLETLCNENPDRVIVVFPECTTSNGRGILPFSPSLLSASPTTKVFAVSLRYTAADITTPIPHGYFTFLWNLCSKPSHCIRIRISEAVYNTSRKQQEAGARSTSVKTNYLDSMDMMSDADTLVSGDDTESPSTKEEKAFLDKIAEALARLGRVKRVGLDVKDKIDFVAMWTRSRK